MENRVSRWCVSRWSLVVAVGLVLTVPPGCSSKSGPGSADGGDGAVGSADSRQDSAAASDSAVASDSVAADDGSSETSDSRGDAALEDCSAPEQTADSIRTFLACLGPFIAAKGYTATDKSSATQAKWEYFVGSNPAGSIYSAQGGSETHVVGHSLAGNKEIATKFLQTRDVTAEAIVGCFVP